MATKTAGLVGQVLAGSRYQVTTKLGEGGMGFVYRARDRHLDCDVVIKVPRRAMIEDAELAGRFAREIRSLVQLGHPHIVKITDVGEHEGLPFAVMQFLPGGNLRDRQQTDSKGKPLPLKLQEVRPWLLDVAAALDFIHAQDYIHRDVKPENILFDTHGHAYLSDFGVAKVLADNSERKAKTALTMVGMVLGTPQHMAPELIMGQRCDGRVDQYALAVMVYELLSGCYPFDGASATAIFMQHTTAPAPCLQEVLPSIPMRVAEAVQKAMAKDPGERYPDCISFAKAVLGDVSEIPIPRARQSSSSRRAAHANPTLQKAQGSLSCPVCSSIVSVSSLPPGKRVRCPECQELIRVPENLQTNRPERQGQEVETDCAIQRQFETMTIPAGSSPRLGSWKQRAQDVPPPVAVPAKKFPGRRVLLLAGGLGVLVLVAVLTSWTLQKNANALIAYSNGLAKVDLVPTRHDTSRGPLLPPASLRLVLLTPEVTLKPGESHGINIRVERQGFQGPIQLQVEGLPHRVAAVPLTVAADQGMVQLELVAAEDAEILGKQARVRAIGGTLTVEEPLWVTVYKSVFLRLLPVEGVTLDAGTTQVLVVQVERHGYMGPIELGMEGLPAKVSMKPTTIAAEQYATKLELAAAPDAPAEEKKARILASVGTWKAEALTTIMVTKPAGEPVPIAKTQSPAEPEVSRLVPPSTQSSQSVQKPTASPPVAPAKMDLYAAIAYSYSTQKFGYGFGLNSLAAVGVIAQKGCLAADAQVVVWTQNGWCALAVSDSSNIIGYGCASSAAEAKRIAVQECLKRAHTCHIAACVFAGK